MNIGYVLLLVLVCHYGVAGQRTPDQELYTFSGDEMTMPCGHGLPDNLWSAYWHELRYFPNGTLETEEMIVEFDIDKEPNMTINSDWEGRFNFTWPDANIHFYDVRLEDERHYRCYGKVGIFVGLMNYTDLKVYDKPSDMKVSWGESETRGCGEIIPRVRHSTDLTCESVSRPKSNLAWTLYKDGEELGVNKTVAWNVSCSGNDPYPVVCKLPFEILYNESDDDLILHKCTMTYEYLNYTEIRETCLMYDPWDVNDSCNKSASVLWILLVIAISKMM